MEWLVLNFGLVSSLHFHHLCTAHYRNWDLVLRLTKEERNFCLVTKIKCWIHSLPEIILKIIEGNKIIFVRYFLLEHRYGLKLTTFHNKIPEQWLTLSSSFIINHHYFKSEWKGFVICSSQYMFICIRCATKTWLFPILAFSFHTMAFSAVKHWIKWKIISSDSNTQSKCEKSPTCQF